MSAADNISTRIKTLGWIARSLAIDLRFGGSLAGDIKTRHRGLGAHHIVNSPYAVFPHMFAGRIAEDDVLVDVGCGKGRLINWWLSRGLRNRIVGIEINPEVAAATARRLRKYDNVTILNADATVAVPDDATLLYMYNPFDGPATQRFKADMERRFGERGITALIWNPEHLEVFQDDPRWTTESVSLEDVGDPRIGGSHSYYVVVQLLPA
jgi:SAM-dependent methyltransferase